MSKNNRYIIIGRSSCPFCIMAQDLLIAIKEKFIFLDYSENVQILDEYKDFHKQKTVPIILSNSLDTGLTKKIGGYTDLLEFLELNECVNE